MTMALEELFARQVQAYGRRGDVLVALSTSGSSPNVIAAAKAGLDLGVTVWALTGPAPNPLAALSDSAIAVDAPTVATVQEIHLTLVHALCIALDQALRAHRMVTAGARGGPLVVLGDSMLDIDIEGEASRLSPEAPVPVVDVTRQRRRPGGAGLAALLAARSGRQVILLTAIGDDDLGNTLRGLLADHVEIRSLPLDGNTVSKCRVAAGEVPLLRLDSGSGRACRGPLPPEAVRTLESAGAILVADYGRGVAGLPALRKALLQKISSVPVIWDPHSNGPTPVRGCWLITPNAAEAQLSSGAGSQLSKADDSA